MFSVREYIYSLMTDKRKGPLEACLKFILWLCSLIYGSIIDTLSAGYEKHFFVPYKADPKVISIGNITMGGTGKTQASITIARLLESRGRKVAILMRGYGADENRMLQEELKDMPILVGQDRIKSSKRAFYDFGVDTVILDDAFQYWKIARDLNIVLLDATNPFGNYNVIPRGILREHLGSLKRADLIIITKVDSKTARLDEVYRVVSGLGKSDCVLESVYKPLGLYDIHNGREMGLNMIDNKKVCIVSSIGNPLYFKQNIEGLGGRVESEFAFMDHYNYKKRDFKKIEDECRILGIDLIVVTKKDAVKIKRLSLAGELAIPILVLDVDFEVTKNKRQLDDGLSGLYINQVP